MIELKNISKVYQLKSGNIDAVKGVSLTVNDGEIYGIIGYSGAGKSTLVRCINLLEVPDSGDITVNGTKITWTDSEGRFNHLSNHDMKTVRKGIGMIFQHFNLLDRSTVFDNIAYPLKYSGLNSEQIKKRVFELLNLVDLTDKAVTCSDSVEEEFVIYNILIFLHCKVENVILPFSVILNQCVCRAYGFI